MFQLHCCTRLQFVETLELIMFYLADPGEKKDITYLRQSDVLHYFKLLRASNFIFNRFHNIQHQ